MPYQSKYGVQGMDGASSSNLSPTFYKYGSPLAMSQYSRNSPLTTPTRSAFRRYSLADTNLTPSPKQSNASYSTHISTKIDSRSPGYSTRIVQYNEEQEKSLSISQSKYDKLGVFPIVHFFKKDLPFPKRKFSDVEKMNSSELSRYNTPEHNRMLLHKIIKSSPANESVSSQKNDTSTKSVLDALKEISRKRIHSNEEELMPKEDNKRMHVDYDSEPTSRKRVKQNLSPPEDSVIVTSPSRISSMGELMASHSSMDRYLTEKPKLQKINVRGHSVTPKKPAPPAKYIDVETQTIVPPTPIITQSKSSPEKEKCEEEIHKSTKQEPTKPKKPSPVKIFDELPLETMRRNRLTALMGTLTKPEKENTKDKGKTEENNTPLGKPLVSILSGAHKSPHKGTKHVTFDIPETVPSTTAANISDNSAASSGASNNLIIPTEVSTPPKAANGINIVTKTSAAIVVPIVSASVVNVVPMNKTTAEIRKETQTPVSFGNPNLSPSTASKVAFTSSLSPPNFNVGIMTTPQAQLGAKPAINLNTEFKERTNETTKVSGDIGTESKFMFGKSVIPPVTSIENSAQKGGFKFELKDPQTSTTSAAYSFMPSPPSTSATKTAAFPAASSKPNLPMFGIPSNTSNNLNPNPSTAFTNKNFAIPSVSFTGNNNLLNPTSTSAKISVSVPLPKTFPSSTATTSSAPIFGNVLTPSFAEPPAPLSKAPLFNFGPSSNVTATATTFGPNKSTSAAVAPSFTFDSAPKSNFGNLGNATSIFPVTLSVAPAVSTSSTSQANSPFGTAISPFTKPVSSSSLPAAFSGNTNKAATNSGFSFNANRSAFNSNVPGFGGDGATKSVFGQGAVPSFGPTTTTASAFGPAAPAPAPAFGTATTTASGFGTTTSAPAFGATTTTPAFGVSTTTSAFGATTTTPAFGVTTTTPAFGVTTTTPAFGVATTTPAFGATTTASAFGNTTPAFGTVTTTASTFGNNSAFGSATNSAFGNNNSTFGPTTASTFTTNSTFGAATTTAPNFGTNSTFGPTTTTAAPTFGPGNPPNVFGNAVPASNNIFGSGSTFGPSTGPGFGANPAPSSSNFGMNQNSTFGGNNDTKNATSHFGAPSSTPFGVTTSTSGFGTNTASFSSSTGFGSTATFGQTNSNAFAPTLGASSPFDNKAAASSFDNKAIAAPFDNKAAASPFDNKSAATTAEVAPFGPGFGSSFPAPQSSQNVFTFGSNNNNNAKPFSFGTSEPPKPSFNFSGDNGSNVFGGMNNKGFGTNPPAFNSLAAPQFNVQPTPAAGNMFNIGTGGSSTPSRSRTQHKAKRRT